MNIALKTTLAAVCLCSTLAFAAESVQPTSPAPDTPEGTVDHRWEGKVDFLRIPQGEIVVGDKMFIFSTNTVIRKKGQQAPVPLAEIKTGSFVRVTPMLPIPEMATPRAAEIEILR